MKNTLSYKQYCTRGYVIMQIQWTLKLSQDNLIGLALIAPFWSTSIQTTVVVYSMFPSTWTPLYIRCRMCVCVCPIIESNKIYLPSAAGNVEESGHGQKKNYIPSSLRRRETRAFSPPLSLCLHQIDKKAAGFPPTIQYTGGSRIAFLCYAYSI